MNDFFFRTSLTFLDLLLVSILAAMISPLLVTLMKKITKLFRSTFKSIKSKMVNSNYLRTRKLKRELKKDKPFITVKDERLIQERVLKNNASEYEKVYLEQSKKRQEEDKAKMKKNMKEIREGAVDVLTSTKKVEKENMDRLINIFNDKE